MKDKRLATPAEAVQTSVTEKLKKRLIREGWASLAYPIWGHDNYNRPWETLAEPVFEVELSNAQWKMVQEVAVFEKTSETTAVCYLILFTMEQLGYHV